MLFTDFNFLFVFLPLVLTLFWSMRSGLFRLCLLLVSSYFFYGYWNHRFIPLLLLSTTVDYLCGIGIGRSQSQTVRKSCLLLSLCCNLGLLGFFKYYGFFTENLNEVLCRMGGEPVFPVLRIVLPVGISFYTFQSMSYTIDVYRGIVSPTRSFIRFAAYVSLFPQLVAGPIVRYRDLAEQLKNVSGRLRLGLLTSGFQLFLLGMFKKVLIADRLARYVNPMFEQYASIGFLEAWVAVTGYAFQIYFDFSGYSDMALGLGKMLGFRFPPTGPLT
jgi:alginate O-acetyltransferase complex protein AlgI